MNMKLTEYLIYIPASVVLAVWVASTLHRHGRRFLVDVFNKDEELADSVNHLLVVGFYLVSLGYVALALHQSGSPSTATDLVESLATKLGLVLVVLGGLHFCNLLVLTVLRSSRPRNGAKLGNGGAPAPATAATTTSA